MCQEMEKTCLYYQTPANELWLPATDWHHRLLAWKSLLLHNVMTRRWFIQASFPLSLTFQNRVVPEAKAAARSKQISTLTTSCCAQSKVNSTIKVKRTAHFPLQLDSMFVSASHRKQLIQLQPCRTAIPFTCIVNIRLPTWSEAALIQ